MEEDKEFTVRDRRSADKKKLEDEHADTDHPSSAAGEMEQQKAGTLPEIDFAAFVLSLATSAQINLGSMPHPDTHQSSQNLPAAKQMIDILSILKEKTKGNLGKEEEKLLDQVLFNLRMHYVRVTEQRKSGES